MLRVLIVALGMILLSATAVTGQTLKGTKTKVQEAYESAKDHDYTFLRTGRDVRRFANLGFLVRMSGNADYSIEGASYPFVRLETRMFVQRLASQMRNACGQKLVVTSATRPTNNQPSNASAKSVHPTGMAVDFRIPSSQRCRSWLESTFRTLHAREVIIPTRERRPPHYHVVVLSKPYADYVASRNQPPEPTTYRVRRGDTLSGIAHKHGTTVTRLKQLNKLKSNTVRVGQILNLPRK